VYARHDIFVEADASDAKASTKYMFGNEHGQVLISVLTAAEGARLVDMAQGLINRCQQASQPLPLLLYVDRDCCSAAINRLFPAWPDLLIRLDVCVVLLHVVQRSVGYSVAGIVSPLPADASDAKRLAAKKGLNTWSCIAPKHCFTGKISIFWEKSSNYYHKNSFISSLTMAVSVYVYIVFIVSAAVVI